MNWYVLLVKRFMEKRVAEKIAAQGIEVYLPSQRVEKKWSDRVKIQDQLVISGTIFVHCEDADRAKTYVMGSIGLHYLADRITHKPLVIPDAQMKAFQTFLSQTSIPIEFSTEHFAPGMKVEIHNKLFAGDLAELVEFRGTKKVIVRLYQLGCAAMELPLDDLVPVKE